MYKITHLVQTYQDTLCNSYNIPTYVVQSRDYVL